MDEWLVAAQRESSSELTSIVIILLIQEGVMNPDFLFLHLMDHIVPVSSLWFC